MPRQYNNAFVIFFSWFLNERLKTVLPTTEMTGYATRCNRGLFRFLLYRDFFFFLLFVSSKYDVARTRTIGLRGATRTSRSSANRRFDSDRYCGGSGVGGLLLLPSGRRRPVLLLVRHASDVPPVRERFATQARHLRSGHGRLPAQTRRERRRSDRVPWRRTGKVVSAGIVLRWRSTAPRVLLHLLTEHWKIIENH